jgi:hypothetical protein
VAGLLRKMAELSKEEPLAVWPFLLFKGGLLAMSEKCCRFDVFNDEIISQSKPIFSQAIFSKVINNQEENG